MKRIALPILLVLTLAFAVFANSVHYKKGPFLVDNGNTATATGALSGLGFGNILAVLSFPNATATTICSNKGSNDVPGQNPALPVPVSGTASYPNPKNGNLAFVVTTNPPSDPSAADAGCPNPNWSARIDQITFGNGTLNFYQDTDGSGDYETLVISTPVSLP